MAQTMIDTPPVTSVVFFSNLKISTNGYEENSVV